MSRQLDHQHDEFEEAREFYTTYQAPSSRSPRLAAIPLSSPATDATSNLSTPAYTHTNGRNRSRSPTPQQHSGDLRTPLTTPRSRANGPPPNKRDFKDLVTRFNQDEAPIVPLTTQERYRRAQQSQKSVKLMKPRSPIKQVHGKPQTRRGPPGSGSRSPRRRIDTAGNPLTASASHDGLMPSASSRSPKRKVHKPLFGEIAYQPENMQELGYGILPARHFTRRGSDSSLVSGAQALSVKSLADIEPSSLESSRRRHGQAARHSRSRSDQTASFSQDPQSWRLQQATDLSQFSSPYSELPFLPISHDSKHHPDVIITTPTRACSQPRSNLNVSGDTRTRTPVSRHQKHPRIALPSSPGRPSDRRRVGSPEKTLRANIVASDTPKSPSLRSSRPRQPVAAATTASSRAKASDRQAKLPKSAEDESEKSKPRRRDPVLGRVDLAERRARIERALSQNLDEKLELDRHSSTASSTRRRSSAASQWEDMLSSPEETKSAVTLDPVGENPKSPFLVDTPQTSFDPAETDFEEDEAPDVAAQVEEPQASSPDILSTSEQENAVQSSARREITEPASPDVSQYEQPAYTSVPQPAGGASPQDFDQSHVSVKIDGNLVDMGVSAIVDSVTLNATFNNQVNAQDDLSPAEVAGAEQKDDQLDLSTVHTPPGSPGVTRFDEHDDTPRQSDGVMRETGYASPSSRRSRDSGETFMQRIIRDFEQTGNIDPILMAELERRGLHTLDSDTSSLGHGSDAQTIQILLDRFTYCPPPDANAPSVSQRQSENFELLKPARYDSVEGQIKSPRQDSTVESVKVLRSQDNEATVHVRKVSSASTGADRSLTSTRIDGVNDNATTGAESIDDRPPPPPKETRWSLGSSIKYASGVTSSDANHLSPVASGSVRNSQQSISLPDVELGGSFSGGLRFKDTVSPVSPSSAAYTDMRGSISLPSPIHATAGAGFVMQPAAPTEPVNPDSPTVGVNPGLSVERSLRPSEESQRANSTSILPSHSISSMSQTSVTAESTDRSSPAFAEDKEPSQVERRLAKRRNIIKELVDTEYSYHQDMKIVEDIYKGTVKDFISTEDRKALFGNVDQVERLSLDLYDAFRRGVATFYVPQKSTRWQAKRGSGISSGAEPQNAADQPSEDQDKLTVVGAVFEQFLPRIEEVYSFYLRNHDMANKRLAVLQTDPTVMLWLEECHKNASDITSAWDLDSLLVKPVQRILKYPLLLQQLLAVTPQDHPDHGALSRAVIESTNVSQRINEAKRRADLVESIVQRKKNNTDVRSGLAKAFGLRTDKVKDRIGMKNEYQDSEYEDLAMKFGGHYVRLQVVMREVQGSLAEIDRAVGKFNSFAIALEAFIDVGQCIYPEIESKWRKFILAIRELSNVALADHKAQIKKRVIEPIVTALRLHESPQSIMAKRKKRMIDFAKCKQMEKMGQKADKKTLEGAEMYTALNEQLKIDLPKLYSLTAQLTQRCLACHYEIQLAWLWTWEMKLRPVLDTFPTTWEEILPDFHADHDLISAQVYSLGLCNGSTLREASQFLSPQMSFSTADELYRPSRADGISSRTQSIGSEYSPSLIQGDAQRSHSSTQVSNYYNANVSINGQSWGRTRSSSSLSAREMVQRGRATSISRQDGNPSPRMPSQGARGLSFSNSRPPTAPRPSDLYSPGTTYQAHQRTSADVGPSMQRASRPASGTSYFSHQEPSDRTQRYSGILSSAMPLGQDGNPQQHHNNSAASALAGIGIGIGGVGYPSHAQQQQQLASPGPSAAGLATNNSTPASPRYAPSDMPVLWVAASLFEFNIDRARREAGYPYMTYVQGEVFDVVGQKGELWLAKNQDDPERALGWIWEQHFVILGRES